LSGQTDVDLRKRVAIMSSLNEQSGPGMEDELAAVADAAGQKLRAEADTDWDAVQAASDALVTAASSAMSAGYELSDIAKAETDGKQAVRNALRGDTLKFVARTGQQAREARIEHHEAIARAMRLGLSTREIAAAAGVTHGTVRAISNRLASGDAPDAADLG
jgi:hypothetical protein